MTDLEDAVMHLMWDFGPDGHSDGSDIIASFIERLLAGQPVKQALDATYESQGMRVS